MNALQRDSELISTWRLKMSRVKAKKKRPLDVESHRYTYAECKEIAEEIANKKAIQLYKEFASQDVDKAMNITLMLACIVMEDVFGFGGGRLFKFHDEVDARLGDYKDGKYSIDDIVEVYEMLWQKVTKYAERNGIEIRV